MAADIGVDGASNPAALHHPQISQTSCTNDLNAVAADVAANYPGGAVQQPSKSQASGCQKPPLEHHDECCSKSRSSESGGIKSCPVGALSSI